MPVHPLNPAPPQLWGRKQMVHCPQSLRKQLLKTDNGQEISATENAVAVLYTEHEGKTTGRWLFHVNTRSIQANSRSHHLLGDLPSCQTKNRPKGPAGCDPEQLHCTARPSCRPAPPAPGAPDLFMRSAATLISALCSGGCLITHGMGQGGARWSFEEVWISSGGWW